MGKKRNQKLRIEILISADTHPDLYDEISAMPKRGRAEHVRFLSRLGMLTNYGSIQKGSGEHHKAKDEVDTQSVSNASETGFFTEDW